MNRFKNRRDNLEILIEQHGSRQKLADTLEVACQKSATILVKMREISQM